jgi:dipeptidyl aminopeptidase/acylaminoacyl peptidase
VTPPGMTPADIGRIVTTSDPRLSPQADWVAYVVTSIDTEANQYRSRIWLVPCAGSTAPTPLTAGAARDRLPRWSPDGAALAFVSHREEDGRGSEIYIVRTAGGEAALVASWPEEVDDLAWSPDGRWIAFGSRIRDEATYGPTKDRDRPARRVRRVMYRFDNIGWTLDRQRGLLIAPADGTARPRVVVSGEDNHNGLAWSPDGSQLAFSAARTDNWDLEPIADLFVVDAHSEGADPRRVTHSTGAMYTSPAWRPDGSSIAFVLRHGQRIPFVSQVGTVAVDDPSARREPTMLTTDLDRTCAPFLAGARDPVWDGNDLWFQVADGGDLALVRVDAGPDGDGKVEQVIGGDRSVTSFDVAGDRLVVCISTPTMPPEVFVVDRTTRSERRHTFVSDAFTSSVALVAPERFSVRSTGGADVDAWIVRPSSFKPGNRYPALVNIHGGPFSSYGSTFFDEFQYQAGSGYAVIYANPRGSDGYGQAWGDAIRGPKSAEASGTGWGGIDFDDVMAVVDEAIRRYDFIDGQRIGVLGGSYGGFLTSWIIAHTDRFAAACSERAVNNQLTMTWTSDIGLRFQDGYIGTSHLKDPDEFLRMSPISYAANVHTPLLILHSDNDLRCPVEQAEQLFVALRVLGRDVEFVRFPGEGHEMSRSGAPKHRIERGDIVLDFFNRHLRPNKS